MTGKISIIMPCYRAEKYIEDTLNDILAQTYTDWELICVSNGAGQEEQLAILRRYEAKSGGKIRVITEEKGDRCRARNIGIKAATGRWITFSDQDDRMEPDHLQRYMDKAEEEEVDIIMGGHRQIRIKEGLTIERRIEGEKLSFKEIALLDNSCLNAVWDKVYRTSFLMQCGVLFHEDMSYLEDVSFVHELLLYRPRVATIAMSGYKWICRDESSGTSIFKHGFWEAYTTDRALERRLLAMAGCTEEEIAVRMAKSDYVQGYFFVCNLFKKGSPLSFREACREIKRIIFDDASMREAMRLKLCNTHTTFLKIFDFAYRFRSPFVMAAIFKMQYALKYSLMPLYLKIAPRLRRW